ELADLGRARFDHDTALATDRDAALQLNVPVAVRQGRAPKGLENQVFAWNAFKYTTEERDGREELKGELHEGMLHRQNRVARGDEGGNARGEMEGGRGRGGFGGGGRGGRNERKEEMDRNDGALCAGKKTGEGAPLAKGFAEELDKGMFWDGPIV
ncbi:hypothetical protein BDU57DRAFT_419958, partial [Ampelomyces quisqualis]